MPFHAKVSTTFLPDIYLTRTEAGGSKYVREPKTVAQSGTDAIVALVYLSGSFTCEIDGRTETIQANEIVFLDLDRPITIQAEKVDNISLVIARQRLEDVSSSVTNIHGYVLRSGAIHDLLLSHMRTCIEVGHRIPTTEAAAVSDVTVRMVAASWNNVTRRTTISARQAGLASLRDIKQFIEGHLGDKDLGPPLLLKVFNLSRATLYRMFEPIGGVAAYILERRMHKAFQIISTLEAEKPRIKQLAMSLGFEHASAFSRAFKKQFGVSPQDVRRNQVIPEDASDKPWKIPRVVALAVEETKRKKQGP